EKLLRFFNYDPEERLGEMASRCCVDEMEKKKATETIRKALGGYSYFKNRYIKA
ncbi:MAG TPA: hypothetical protein HA349_01500, partial [Methanotrichaceae archaeon]|nr:hypothetical protein [Methanotrichaceae archaeon]